MNCSGSPLCAHVRHDPASRDQLAALRQRDRVAERDDGIAPAEVVLRAERERLETSRILDAQDREIFARSDGDDLGGSLPGLLADGDGECGRRLGDMGVRDDETLLGVVDPARAEAEGRTVRPDAADLDGRRRDVWMISATDGVFSSPPNTPVTKSRTTRSATRTPAPAPSATSWERLIDRRSCRRSITDGRGGADGGRPAVPRTSVAWVPARGAPARRRGLVNRRRHARRRRRRARSRCRRS